MCKQGHHTLFVSLEMSKTEIMDRLVSNMAQVKSEKIKRKKGLTKDEIERIVKAKQEIKKYKLNSYTKGGLKIEQLMGLAKHLKKQGKLDVLIVDYLQLLETFNNRENEYQRVSTVSRKLKELAMDLNIPVIALSQLSRNSIKDGKPQEPHLSDLRSSGSLEQDANSVIMLHSDDSDEYMKEEKFIKLYVRKNRDGALGMIRYKYYGDYLNYIEQRWLEKESRYQDVVQDEIFRNDIKEKKVVSVGLVEDILPF